MALHTMNVNDTLSDDSSNSGDNSSVDSDEDAPPFRLDNCVFNPVDLNSDGTNACLFNNSNSEYLTCSQLRAKSNRRMREPFTFFHTNIRSINKNHDELFLLLRELNIDIQIIGLTETWLKAPPDSVLLINGYKC